MVATLSLASHAQKYQIAFQSPLGVGTFTFDTNRLVITQNNRAGTWFFDSLATMVFQGITNLNWAGVSLRANAVGAVHGAISHRDPWRS